MKELVQLLITSASIFFTLSNAFGTNFNDVIECPAEDAPVELLRAKDVKKLNEKQFQIMSELHGEFHKILSTENYLTYLRKRRFARLVVGWHFNFVVEEAFEQISKINVADIDDLRTIKNVEMNLEKDWTFLNENKHGIINMQICHLHGFVHRIMRNETLNSKKEWPPFVKSEADGIFSIDVGPEFGKENTTTLSEEEYEEYVKKCDEFEYANSRTAKLFSSKSTNLIYRLSLHRLIANSEVFQQFLCYHKNVLNYKKWLYNDIMRLNDLLVLEETFPNIMHIEIFPQALRIEAHKTQFESLTNSENAIRQECRILFRRLMGDPNLKEYEKTIRQNADGQGFGKHMLDKLNAVKKSVMTANAISSPKGICVMNKLLDFLREFGKSADTKNEIVFLKKIDHWWPTDCDRTDEANSVFQMYRMMMYQINRKEYTEFMRLWKRLITVRGGATRLRKYLQMTELEIELHWVYDKELSDTNVFRNVKLGEKHYQDAFRAEAEPAEQQMNKLAADIFSWVFWLENNILELKEEHKANKMPRFTMAWRLNRWYYEMVYDQLFDIEKADEKVQLENKRQEIGILLQLSTKLVMEKMKMPDEKLKVETERSKIKRLAKSVAVVPPGTLDRDWYGIRRKSEARREKVGHEFQQWLQQTHFSFLTTFMCKNEKFNSEFEESKSFNGSLERNMRIAEFVGEEKVNEIYESALKCKAKFENDVDDGQQHENGRQSSNESPKSKETKVESAENIGTKAEKVTSFDLDAALAFVNSGANKKGIATKNAAKNNSKKKSKKKSTKNAANSEPKTNSSEEKSTKNQPKKVKTEKDNESKENNEAKSSIEMPPNSPTEEEAPKIEENNEIILEVQKREENAIESEKGTLTERGKKRSDKRENGVKKKCKITKKEKNGIKLDDKNILNEFKKENNKDTANGSEIIKGMEENKDINEAETMQKEFGQIGLLDNENGWNLFFDDKFLIKCYQKFFINSTKSMQQIVTIGCYINEIGHRMEVIEKLYPIGGDQTFLNALKGLELAPSKWIHKKLEQSWQQIKIGLMKTVVSTKRDQTIDLTQSDQMAKVDQQNVDKFDLKIFRKMLSKHMKMIIKFVDANAIEGKSVESEESDIDFIEQQIHLRKMALALLSEIEQNQNEFVWSKMSDQSRALILRALFGTEFGLASFYTFSDHFWEMFVQLQQDQKLLKELLKMEQNNFIFAKIFGISLHLQEITLLNGENANLIGSDSNNSVAELSSLLTKNGFGLINNERKLKIEQAIQAIEQIAKKWNSKAKFLVTGSYQLGVLTKNSDIDVICIVPELSSWEMVQFFGGKKCEMRLDSARVCADKSLYCHLCQVPKVTMLNRIQDAWMPLIELKYEIEPNIFIDFDIGIATFGPNEQIFQSKEPIKFKQCEALSLSLASKIGQLANENKTKVPIDYEKKMELKGKEENLKMKLRSLSGFEISIIILNKIFATENNANNLHKINILKTYQSLLLAVKMWSKEHHIYDNKLGFFNGISLSILVAKVMLLYPMASIPFLIEKFFFTFSTWPWPTPVKLTDLPDGSALRWEPSDELRKRHEIANGLVAELTMPIVTPGQIEQNATFNINRYTAMIIQHEMQQAIKCIRNWPNLTDTWDQKWKSLLKSKKFKEKYSHFIRIICKAKLLADFYEFCGFVGTRIRLQLLNDVQPFEHIRLAHAKKIMAKESHTETNQNGDKETFFHDIWLVGLELDDGIFSGDGIPVEISMNSKEWVESLNGILSHKFDANIDRAFRLKKNLIGNKKIRIQLTSKYEKK